MKSFLSLVCKRRNDPESINEPELKKKPKLDCSICQSSITSAMTTKCGHTFCEKCIDTHLESKTVCPNCRKELSGSVLYPSNKLGSKDRMPKRVKNRVVDIIKDSKIYVKDNNGEWCIGVVKMVIPYGDDFPFILVEYNNDTIEILPKNSERLAPFNDSKKIPEQWKNLLIKN